MDLYIPTVTIFRQVLTVFSLIVFGIIARKANIFKEEAKASFTDIVMNLTLPSLIFVSMVANTTWERLLLGTALPFIALALILLMLFFSLFASFLLGRLRPTTGDRQRTLSVLCAMPNSGFIGFPVILSVLGEEGLAYAVLYDIGVTIAFFSVAVLALKGGAFQKDNWKRLINPLLVATALGLIVNKIGLTIPELILTPLQTMGNATVPMIMILMGYMLGDFKSSFKIVDWELGLVCLCKLLLYPLFAYLLVLPLNLDPLVRTVVLIQAAMPSMASTSVLVEKYGGDNKFAVKAIFVTTLLSVITIPLMVSLLL